MITHADDLEREIAAEQNALGENLAKLEHQAKELLDLRSYVRKNPLAMMGVAFGGGVLLAAMAGSSKSRSGARRGWLHESNGDEDPPPPRDTWEVFKGALLGAAAAQVTSYVAEVLPDFREHLDEQRRERAARRRKSRPASARNGDSEPGSENIDL
ncbi:MAG TPA: hypothetical protein VHE78_05660 [Gemmatimonadaceae bacterium]|nr:hypothetical protein [Gemmatimonadaceae bacterium]